MKNGQTYFRNLVVLTPQNFKSMFRHFSRLCVEGLICKIFHKVCLYKNYAKYFTAVNSSQSFRFMNDLQVNLKFGNGRILP